uniref:NADH-ubiquinone oxidoreductase chain 5 n=1 Tax=Sinanodonta woodiana TaxID=1069815 RepID=A0A1L1WJ47_SINWO|nr:NADH dehydrogenase subunit 5 [Sinanodonta woodiana]
MFSVLVWSGTLLFSCFCLSLFLLSGMMIEAVVLEWEFISGWGFSMSVLVLVDQLSIGFSFTVCLISGCIFMYSMSYMEGEKFIDLFSGLVGCFVGAMNILIYIPHLAFMLLGWDLLGIVSFLLVIFYQNHASVGAGMLTILVNRLGDVFLLLAIGLISETSMWGIMYNDFPFEGYVGFIVAFLIVSACMTKSAQMPFSVWLPAAMAAPTPVSALVHSSTLVTAGVYVMFRHYSFLSSMDGLLLVGSKIGCLTLLMASLAACFEVDIKKLIALSTLGHLGFMVYVLGLGYPILGFFHMIMHALFKSLLFLCVGCYIHLMMSCQDLRQLQGVGWTASPLLMSCSIVGFSSLCGIPYLSGFYSKDAILESSLMAYSGVFEVVCMLLSGMISYVYSMRILLKTVFNSFGGVPSIYYSFESSSIGIPLFVLALSSVVAGCMVQGIWVESCHSFIVSPLIKVFMFLILNSGNVLIVMSQSSFVVFSKPSIFMNWYMTFVKMCSTMWFMRWLFFLIPGVWYNNVGNVAMVLEAGWMEMLGGHLFFLSFGGTSVKAWILERMSLLLIVRMTSVFIFGFYFFLLY